MLIIMLQHPPSSSIHLERIFLMYLPACCLLTSDSTHAATIHSFNFGWSRRESEKQRVRERSRSRQVSDRDSRLYCVFFAGFIQLNLCCCCCWPYIKPRTSQETLTQSLAGSEQLAIVYCTFIYDHLCSPVHMAIDWLWLCTHNVPACLSTSVHTRWPLCGLLWSHSICSAHWNCDFIVYHDRDRTRHLEAMNRCNLWR